MDKTYVVSYINLYDHDLISEIVQAKSVKEAIGLHSKIKADWFKNEDLEDLKVEAFDQDSMIEVIEIPTSTLDAVNPLEIIVVLLALGLLTWAVTL